MFTFLKVITCKASLIRLPVYQSNHDTIQHNLYKFYNKFKDRDSQQMNRGYRHTGLWALYWAVASLLSVSGISLRDFLLSLVEPRLLLTGDIRSECLNKCTCKIQVHKMSTDVIPKQISLLSNLSFQLAKS